MHQPCTPGWSSIPPKFLCAFSETPTNLDNDLVDTLPPVPQYKDVTYILKTDTGSTHTPDRLTYIYCYMDDFIMAVQGRTYIHTQLLDRMV